MEAKDVAALRELLEPGEYAEFEASIRQKLQEEISGILLSQMEELKKENREVRALLESRTSDLANLLFAWNGNTHPALRPPFPPMGAIAFDPKEQAKLLKVKIEECLQRLPTGYGVTISDIIHYLEEVGFPVHSDYWQWRGATSILRIYSHIANYLHYLSKKGRARKARMKREKGKAYWLGVKAEEDDRFQV